MAIYKYEAMDKSGNTVSGSMDSTSREAVKDELEKLNLYPVEIFERELHTKHEPSSFTKRPGITQIALFTRQMGTLLDAGLNVIESLETVQGQSQNQIFTSTVSDLKSRVNHGESLSAAMENHNNIFPPMYTSMILAGEQSGQLPSIMVKIADYYDKAIKLRNKIIVSLAYPAVMTITGCCILFFLVTFIAPTLTEVFVDNNQALPLPTVILMSTSAFFQKYWLFLGAILLGILFILKKWFQTDEGRKKLDQFALNAPVFGRITLGIALARFTRTFGVLLESGVEILSTFEITSKVTGNSILAEALIEVKERVSEGEDISSSLIKTKLFPPIVVDMVRAGQKSGRLPELMIKIADDLDEEVETQMALMTSLIEPVMILIMGTVVGFIVLAVVLPIFEMNQIY
jgi:type II secretory pathway component PulF